MKNTSEILDRCRKVEAEKAEEKRRIADRRIAILKSRGTSCDDGWWAFQCSNSGAILSFNLDGELGAPLSNCPTIQANVRQIVSTATPIVSLKQKRTRTGLSALPIPDNVREQMISHAQPGGNT
jgi:hypothetical protein